MVQSTSPQHTPSRPEAIALIKSAQYARLDVGRVMARARFYEENPGQLFGVSWGWPVMDDNTDGILNDDTIAVTGGPGSGKTMFALNLTRNLLMQGKHVAYWALEQDQTSLAFRLAALFSGVPAKAIKKGSYWDAMSNCFRTTTREQRDAFYTALGELHSKYQLGLRAGAVDAQLIWDTTRALKSVGRRPDLVVVDYAGLILGEGSSDTQRVRAAIAKLRQMTLLEEVPTLLVGQIGRGVGQRENKRPTLTDGSDTSEFEKAPTVYLGLYRESYYAAPGTPIPPVDVTEVLCLKNREGGPFTALMDYHALTGRLTEHEPDHVPGVDLPHLEQAREEPQDPSLVKLMWGVGDTPPAEEPF